MSQWEKGVLALPQCFESLSAAGEEDVATHPA